MTQATTVSMADPPAGANAAHVHEIATGTMPQQHLIAGTGSQFAR
jgi:hypothetical protein